MSQPPPRPSPDDESDSGDDLPAGAFLASMPWWVVLGRHSADTGSPGSPGSPTSAGYLVLDVDGGTCLAVFTDEDLAQRFVAEAQFDGGPLPVDTPERFWQLARRLPRICTYAAFDPPAKVGGRARWVVPLADVLKALAAAQREFDAGRAEDQSGD
jgi:hypothetical protein